MRKNTTAPRRATALFLTALMCGTYFSGCSQHSSNAAAPEETAAAVQAEQTVTIGTQQCDTLAKELTVVNADAAQLQQAIPLLPNLEKLTLEGTLPETQTLLLLKDQFPQVTLVCRVELGGKTVSTDAQLLDLTDTTPDPEALKEYLPLFSGLQE